MLFLALLFLVFGFVLLAALVSHFILPCDIDSVPKPALPTNWKKFTYVDFRSSLAFFFSLIDFAGFFLASFLMFLDFAITDLALECAPNLSGKLLNSVTPPAAVFLILIVYGCLDFILEGYQRVGLSLIQSLTLTNERVINVINPPAIRMPPIKELADSDYIGYEMDQGRSGPAVPSKITNNLFHHRDRMTVLR